VVLIEQGWKPEKNLRFLLQKVLKQSDVGNLGRIVLPKVISLSLSLSLSLPLSLIEGPVIFGLNNLEFNQKEAETHLPELEARDGISIAMEDIGTSRVWNMRYRYSMVELSHHLNLPALHSIFILACTSKIITTSFFPSHGVTGTGRTIRAGCI
jgi:hypothetical protein